MPYYGSCKRVFMAGTGLLPARTETQGIHGLEYVLNADDGMNNYDLFTEIARYL